MHIQHIETTLFSLPTPPTLFKEVLNAGQILLLYIHRCMCCDLYTHIHTYTQYSSLGTNTKLHSTAMSLLRQTSVFSRHCQLRKTRDNYKRI